MRKILTCICLLSSASCALNKTRSHEMLPDGVTWILNTKIENSHRIAEYEKQKNKDNFTSKYGEKSWEALAQAYLTDYFEDTAIELCGKKPYRYFLRDSSFNYPSEFSNTIFMNGYVECNKKY